MMSLKMARAIARDRERDVCRKRVGEIQGEINGDGRVISEAKKPGREGLEKVLVER